MPKSFRAVVAVAFVVVSAFAAVRDKVVPKVRPFPLSDVRLLDGPFKQAMLLDQQYLLSLDPDRLLHNFRVNAGLPSSAKPLSGWEAPGVELRGHTVGHYLSALALMYASTGDGRFKARADAMVAELAKIQAADARRFHLGYRSTRQRGRGACRAATSPNGPLMSSMSTTPRARPRTRGRRAKGRRSAIA